MIGSYRHLVTLSNPGPAVADGDGGYVQTRLALDPPTWRCSIMPATARDLERVTAGTVVSSATHIVKGRYHPGITTKTQVVFGARVLNVTGLSNPEERNIETIAVCEEVVA